MFEFFFFGSSRHAYLKVETGVNFNEDSISLQDARCRKSWHSLTRLTCRVCRVFNLFLGGLMSMFAAEDVKIVYCGGK